MNKHTTIKDFLNEHFCLSGESISMIFRKLKNDFGKDFANELENAIYSYNIRQIEGLEDDEE
jgi:hypothetical protein